MSNPITIQRRREPKISPIKSKKKQAPLPVSVTEGGDYIDSRGDKLSVGDKNSHVLLAGTGHTTGRAVRYCQAIGKAHYLSAGTTGTTVFGEDGLAAIHGAIIQSTHFSASPGTGKAQVAYLVLSCAVDDGGKAYLRNGIDPRETESHRINLPNRGCVALIEATLIISQNRPSPRFAIGRARGLVTSDDHGNISWHLNPQLEFDFTTFSGPISVDFSSDQSNTISLRITNPEGNGNISVMAVCEFPTLTPSSG